MGYWYTYADLHDQVPQRMGHSWEPMAPYGVFYTQTDPVYLAIGLEKQWESLCRAMDRPEWRADPRFETNEERIQHRDEIHELIDETFMNYERDELIDTLLEEHVPVAEVDTVDQAAENEQLQARNSIVEVEDAEGRTVRAAGVPIQFSDAPAFEFDDPPGIGEHTEEILADVGFSNADIDRFSDSGAIGDD